MPSEYIADQTGRYVRLKWQRDAHEPGHVQIATAAEGVDGEFVDLDERAIDKLIKALHKAKSQALAAPSRFAQGGLVSAGETVLLTPGPEVTVESAATAADRLDVEGYRATRRGDR
jgi:hypothetical protein